MNIRDKYRPRSLDDLVFPTEAVSKEINYYAQIGTGANPGNLLLHGPIGTAKSTLISLLAHHLLGDSYDFNASVLGGTGVNTAAQVKQAIERTAALVPVDHIYRIILIDELCAMLPAGQRELRSLIDLHQQHCLFLLTANDIEAIDLGVISRCRTVLFGYAPPERWLPRARNIVASEKVTIADETLLVAIEGAAGDVRRILQNIQDLVNIRRMKRSDPK
ncbi:MAG: AAA family ATPase [Rhodospirillaceae bacterium]